MKAIGVQVKDEVAEDLKAICAHHGHSVSAVMKMMIGRVVRYSERLPAAMAEFEGAKSEQGAAVEDEVVGGTDQ